MSLDIIKFRSNDRLLVTALLLLACLSIVLFQNNVTGFSSHAKNYDFATTGFNPHGHHGHLSAHGMSISKNLMLDDAHFLMFNYKGIKDDGKVFYDPYNRFPVFPFLLTGVVINMFEPDIALQVYAGRQVMNFFFILAFILCFAIIKDFTNNDFLAFAAAAAAFSSFLVLYYSDMVFNDIPAFFGFLMALYIAVKSTNKGLSSLKIILFSIISISCGWQPYSVFITWLVLDAISLLITDRKAFLNFKKLFRRPSVMAFAAALTWGIFVLVMQTLNEWLVIGGPLQELPTLYSMLSRTGIKHEAVAFGFSAWLSYAKDQIKYMLDIVVPFRDLLIEFPHNNYSYLLISALFAYCMIRSRKEINFLPLAVLMLSGTFWAVTMRGFVFFHNFQTLFYIGVPIAFYMLLVLLIRNPGISKAVAFICCLLFVLSVYNVNIFKEEQYSERSNLITAEFQNIYNKLPKNSRVYLDGKSRLTSQYIKTPYFENGALDLRAPFFYLARSYQTSLNIADYVVSMNPDYNSARLTDNEHFNLFRNIPKSHVDSPGSP